MGHSTVMAEALFFSQPANDAGQGGNDNSCQVPAALPGFDPKAEYEFQVSARRHVGEAVF